jgi:hypothetical protein
VTSADLAALRRILVVKLFSLGDIVQVMPCLRALRRALQAAPGDHQPIEDQEVVPVGRMTGRSKAP